MRHTSGPRASKSRERHAKNISKLLRLLEQGHFEHSAPLDHDRLSESIENFIEINRSKSVLSPQDMRPKRTHKGQMLSRSIVGSTQDF